MSRWDTLASRVPHLAGLRQRIRTLRDRQSVTRLAGPELIRAFAARFPAPVFIEIGANDGEQHDHLRPMIVEHRWHGVMVEPVPYVFERLRANYGTFEWVALENAAITDHDGRVPFYHLAASPDFEKEGLPQWYDAIGSFSKDTILDHGRVIPDIEARLVETEVPCLTFDSLCTKHGLEQVDLLLLDTEGYDYEILRQINFSVHRPVLVIYEHYHLAPSDRAACRARMHEAGYETMAEGFDTWCLRPDADPRLALTWRRLRPAVPELTVQEELR